MKAVASLSSGQWPNSYWNSFNRAWEAYFACITLKDWKSGQIINTARVGGHEKLVLSVRTQNSLKIL